MRLFVHSSVRFLSRYIDLRRVDGRADFSRAIRRLQCEIYKQTPYGNIFRAITLTFDIFRKSRRNIFRFTSTVVAIREIFCLSTATTRSGLARYLNGENHALNISSLSNRRGKKEKKKRERDHSGLPGAAATLRNILLTC